MINSIYEGTIFKLGINIDFNILDKSIKTYY